MHFNIHRNKSIILFGDNGSCRVNHKHHHSTKNLSNSQQNSAANTNSRNVSGGSDDFEERDSGSGRAAAAPLSDVLVFTGTSDRNIELQEQKPENRNSPYCISLGEMATISSQSSINFVGGRPSFYSDPTRQSDWDNELKS